MLPWPSFFLALGVWQCFDVFALHSPSTARHDKLEVQGHNSAFVNTTKHEARIRQHHKEGAVVQGSSRLLSSSLGSGSRADSRRIATASASQATTPATEDDQLNDGLLEWEHQAGLLDGLPKSLAVTLMHRKRLDGGKVSKAKQPLETEPPAGLGSLVGFNSLSAITAHSEDPLGISRLAASLVETPLEELRTARPTDDFTKALNSATHEELREAAAVDVSGQPAPKGSASLDGRAAPDTNADLLEMALMEEVLSTDTDETPITGSHNWMSCWHDNMHSCAEGCCCNEGSAFDLRTRSCGTGISRSNSSA